jgi:hypothetical protein
MIRRLFMVGLLAFSTLAGAASLLGDQTAPATRTISLLSAATGTGAGTGKPNAAITKTYQASGTTASGSGAATILVQGSNDDANWDTIGTITLTLGVSSTSGSFVSADRYLYVRGNVSSISGTGASVNASAGY